MKISITIFLWKAKKNKTRKNFITKNGDTTFIEEPTAKIVTLQIMMNKFAPNKTFSFTEGDFKPISVIKIEVQAYTAKKH